MRFQSTRGEVGVSLKEALLQGLARDGGLYVPSSFPQLRLSTGALPQFAAQLLEPFFVDSELAAALPDICRAAYSFEVPLVALGERAHLLELFWGPTASFKDFGARFLAQCLHRLAPEGGMVLVATSGDTGSAVADAFSACAGFSVRILYPDGMVSARQAHHLGAFGDTARAYRVAGTFDDCQRMVKAAFAHEQTRQRCRLTSANSISLGRLLPQIAYFAHAAYALGNPPRTFIIPTGNLGNAMACLYAKEMGAPIASVILATNANTSMSAYAATGQYQPHPTVATLANAMDVGSPSNAERFAYQYPKWPTHVEADSVDDAAIRARIAAEWKAHGRAICPHTACAFEILRRRESDGRHYVVVATAHPAKFEAVVEPLIGQTIPVPAQLEPMTTRLSTATPLTPVDAALIEVLLGS